LRRAACGPCTDATGTSCSSSKTASRLSTSQARRTSPERGIATQDDERDHPTRAVTFAINVAAVIYLLVSKRLFGLRGGRKAYDEERRGEQLLDIERAATSR